MANETGKSRSQRIEIDYYKRASGLSRWRTACIVAACILSAAYILFATLFASTRSQLSTGDVANVHASFENDCQQCHLEFNPVARDAKSIDLPMFGIVPSETNAATEAKCLKCHAVGHHFRDEMVLDGQMIDQNCAGCHHDHMGRGFDMVAIQSDQCVQCHGALAEKCTGSPSVRDAVTTFTEAAHGNFRSLGLTGQQVPNPGSIKFDHAQHMRAGQVEAGQRGGMTLSRMPASSRPKYASSDQDPESLVQLDCASCHEFDGQPRDGFNMLADAELGRYMAPVNFETHCASCHPVLPAVPSNQTPVIPHAVPWEQVDVLVAAIADGQRDLKLVRQLGDDTQTIAKLGEGLGQSNGQTLDTRVDSISATDLRSAIMDQCRLCHEEDALTDKVIAESMADEIPPMIPARWFQKGLYDHAAHREIDCRYCHGQAYGPEDTGEPSATLSPPTDNEVVMIGGIETCQGCHRDPETTTPRELVTAEATGLFGSLATWASNDCVMCHRYHTPMPENDRAMEIPAVASAP